MTILIVGLSLLLGHWFGRYWRRPRQRLMNLWFSRLAGRFAGAGRTPAIVGMLVMIGVPAAVLGATQWLLKDYSLLAWFGFSLFGLLFAWGPRDLDRDVKGFLDAESADDRESQAQLLNASYRDRQPVTDSSGVIRGVFYQSLVRWFGVIFWFLLLGAAGAVAFRLAHALLSEPRNRALLAEPQEATARWLVESMDFVPAALTTLGLAMVGNFDAVFASWREQWRDPESGARSLNREFFPEVGFQIVMHGDQTYRAFSHDYEGDLAKVNHAMSLVWRLLVCWLTVVALLIILGVVS